MGFPTQKNFCNEITTQDTQKLKLKISSEATKINYLDYNIPYIMLKKSKFDKEEKKTLTIKSKILDYSARKLAPFCKLLVGKSIDEALQICETTHSKGASYSKDYLK